MITKKERGVTMKFTESELQIMELFWNSEKPLASPDILEQSPKDKLWKDNSIFIMIQTLQKKDAIREIGAVKGEKGKYLRLFEPTLSRQEYYSKQFPGSLESKDIPVLFSALIKDADLSKETINELEDILRRKKTEIK